MRLVTTLCCATVLLLLLVACNKTRLDEGDGTGKQAARTGVGAGLGTLVYGIIMDDPDAMRRAVAVGAAAATTTAVVEGSQTTKGEAKQERWEQELGKNNADAIVNLVHRDYGPARKNLAAASASGEERQVLAAQWLSAVLARDIGDEEAEKAAIGKIIASDPKTPDEATANKKLDQLMERLKELRSNYG